MIVDAILAKWKDHAPRERRRPSPKHLRWPEFDIDLDVDAIENPARYPLRERRLLGDPAAVVARLRLERAAAPRRTARIG